MIEFSQNADVTNKCNPPPPQKKTPIKMEYVHWFNYNEE